MSSPKPPTAQPQPQTSSDSPFGRLQLSTFLATGLVALVAVGIALGAAGSFGTSDRPAAAPPAPVSSPVDLAEACVAVRGVRCPELERSPEAQRTWERCRTRAAAQLCLALAEQGVSRRGTTSP